MFSSHVTDIPRVNIDPLNAQSVKKASYTQNLSPMSIITAQTKTVHTHPRNVHYATEFSCDELELLISMAVVIIFPITAYTRKN
jgi:hypothetical protein